MHLVLWTTDGCEFHEVASYDSLDEALARAAAERAALRECGINDVAYIVHTHAAQS